MTNDQREEVTRILTTTTEKNMIEFNCSKKEAGKMAVERLLLEHSEVSFRYFTK